MDQLLLALLSPNNHLRRQAEESYQLRLNSDVQQRLQVLSELIQVLNTTNAEPSLRSLACVLIKRLVLSTETAIDQTYPNLKAALLEIWVRETDAHVARRIAHLLAETAAASSWPELLPSVLQGIDQNNQFQVSAVLSLVEILTEYSNEIILQCLGELQAFLAMHLNSSNPKLQVSSAKAIASFVATCEDDNARNSFKAAVQPLLQVTFDSLNRGEELDATTIMSQFVDIAEVQPMFFKGVIDMLVNFLVEVTQNHNFEFSTRSMALEVMVTLAESAPALARKCPALVQKLPHLSMLLAIEVEDDDETDWVKEKYSEEIADEPCLVGEEAIERLAAGLGGKVVLPITLPIIQEYIRQPKWTYRRAAVAVIARLAEGCTKTMLNHFNDTVNLLRQLLGDSSPRVIYQVIQTVGQFALLFEDSVESLVGIFFQPFTAFLASQSCDRVRGHAASALINLCDPDKVEPEVLQPFVDGVMQAIVLNLQHASIEVKIPCLLLLGCIARTSKDAFLPYYTVCMDGIRSIAISASSPDAMTYRGKAIECIGVLAEAVGGKVFENDAANIMPIIMNAIHVDHEDFAFDYVLPACARISKSLSAHFEPLLPPLIDILLRVANQEIKSSIEDANEDDIDGQVDYDEENGLVSTVVSVKGVKKRSVMNIFAIMQKQKAARILHDFASNLKGHMKSHLSPCAHTTLSLIAEPRSSDIRAAAALSLSRLFEAYLDAGQRGFVPMTEVNEAFKTFLQRLLALVGKETAAVARSCQVDAIQIMLQACLSSGAETPQGKRVNLAVAPDMNQSKTLVSTFLVLCNETVTRMQKQTKLLEKEGFDEEDADKVNDAIAEDDGLLRELIDTMGLLIKIHKEDFAPLFESMIVPAFAPYLDTKAPSNLQFLAICMMDDGFEFGGASMFKYHNQAMSLFVQNLNSDDLTLRQCSSYGITQIVRSGNNQAIAPHFASLVARSFQLATSSDSRDDDNIGTTENILAMFTFLLSNDVFRTELRNLDSSGVQRIAGLVLNSLPLTSDEAVAKTTHECFCQILESNNNADILGSDGSNIGRVLKIIGEILERNQSIKNKTSNNSEDDFLLAFDDTAVRLLQFVRNINAMIGNDQFASVVGQLPQNLLNLYRTVLG